MAQKKKATSTQPTTTTMKTKKTKKKTVSADTGESSSKAAARTAQHDADNHNEKDASGTFRSLRPPLAPGILAFLDGKGFQRMTPVQEATIPLFRENRDVAVQAVTGSGKTLAFLIPLLEKVAAREWAKHRIGGLVLSPTRELARQTWRVCADLCASMGLRAPLLLVGGGSGGSGANHRPVAEDLRRFRADASDVIVGTPGRIEDVLTRYTAVDASELEVLVLDEADVLLLGGGSAAAAAGHVDPTIASILSRLPKMRRTGIFSATTTFSGGGGTAKSSSLKPLLQRAGMRNPVLVNVQVASAAEKKAKASSASSYTPTTLTNYYCVTPPEEKISRLVAFLRSHRTEKVMVFFLTCACVDFYGNALKRILSPENDDHGVPIELLHGKLVQKRREKTMATFRGATGGMALFCTDVAARGLDVDDVDWVCQADAPKDPAQFVHRVGRAARAGRTGKSLVFLTEKEEAYVDLLANRRVVLSELPPEEACLAPMASDDSNATNNNTVENILPKIRGLVLEDRDFLEKGTRAFTSYIRAYKEHLCAFIFRFASLDLGHLATSFCLLRLPKMPELRDCHGKLKHFVPAGPEVSIFGIPYQDKAREAARQKRLAEELAAGGKNAKQIRAEQRKADQAKRQQEKRKQALAKGRNPDKKRGRHQQIVDEWDDLAREERLYKKLRRGKITKDQYEQLLRGGGGTSATQKPAHDESDSSSTSST